MKASRKILLAGLAVLLLAQAVTFVVGCNNSTDTEGDSDDDADDDAVQDDDDDDSTPPDTTPPDPPFVDPVTSPTYLDLQTITGLAEAGSLVEITGGLSPASTFAGADGEWCVTVYLDELAVNTLSVTAKDAADNRSEPTTAQIEQAGPEDPSNQTLNKPAEGSSTSTGHPENTPDKAVDGDANTRWDNSTWTPNPNWLKVFMGEFIQVERMRIIWSSTDTAYADRYEIRINPDRYATTEPTASDWITVYTNNSGEGGTVTFDLPTPFGGWWVAIVLNRSVSGTLHNEYQISEFEAWGYPFTEPDPGCE